MKYIDRERLSNYLTLFVMFLELDLFVLILFELSFAFSAVVYSIGAFLVVLFVFELLTQFALNPAVAPYLARYWFQYLCLAVIIYSYSRFRTVRPTDPLLFIYSKLFLGIVEVFLFANFIMHLGKLREIFGSFRVNPAQVIILSFGSIIVFGSFLLYLPYSRPAGTSVRYIDALFTSTSAVCVTGLAVVDAGTAFSRVGQVFLLLLIQTGGLGIMTIAAFIQVSLGSDLSLYGRISTASILDQGSLKNLYSLMRSIVLITFIVEAAGAVSLYPHFAGLLTRRTEAIFHSVFHAVSAFCNAGFSLYPDNLMHALGDIWVNFVVCSLIVTGGLGFTVIVNLFNRAIRGTGERITVQTRMVISTTAFLIVFGAGVFYLLERGALMKAFKPHEKFLASVFQSVTARTAGFNTVDIGALGSVTHLMLIVLMFVGASPGGTGGGIKTTTLFVLVLSIVTILRDQRFNTIFMRRIPYAVVNRAFAILVTSAALVIAATLIMGFSEKFTAVQLLFETTSAFGTVGLSTGITSSLSDFGKVVIILLMFVGRIGSLTLVLAVGTKPRTRLVTYPEERIMVG
jgi:trk system potassium uptake protein TrkH